MSLYYWNCGLTNHHKNLTDLFIMTLSVSFHGVCCSQNFSANVARVVIVFLRGSAKKKIAKSILLVTKETSTDTNLFTIHNMAKCEILSGLLVESDPAKMH